MNGITDWDHRSPPLPRRSSCAPVHRVSSLIAVFDSPSRGNFRSKWGKKRSPYAFSYSFEDGCDLNNNESGKRSTIRQAVHNWLTRVNKALRALASKTVSSKNKKESKEEKIPEAPKYRVREGVVFLRMDKHNQRNKLKGSYRLSASQPALFQQDADVTDKVRRVFTLMLSALT